MQKVFDRCMDICSSCNDHLQIFLQSVIILQLMKQKASNIKGSIQNRRKWGSSSQVVDTRKISY
jgi:hypothetical protein